VTRGPACLGVWDLGYVSDGDMVSDGKPTKMCATAIDDCDGFLVHPTPDNLGIRILTYSYVPFFSTSPFYHTQLFKKNSS